MIVIDKKPIPIYESKCHECGSVFRYKKAEVGWGCYITCPVCGVSVWADTINPVVLVSSGLASSGQIGERKDDN